MKTLLLNFKNWVSGITSAIIGNNNTINDIPNPDEHFKNSIQIKALDKNQDVSKTFRDILVEIGKVGENFRKAGISDGMLSMSKKSINSIVSDSVKRTRSYVETIFNGLEQKVRTKLNTLEVLKTHANEALNTNKDYLKTLKRDYQWNPNSFSITVGLFYLLVGIALIYADVILSYKVTGEAFDLEAKNDKYYMAIGIALCAVYIKIYFDIYMLPSIERSVTRFKKDNLPGTTGEPKEINKIKLVWKRRLFFNTLLLLLCLGTIVALGYLRYDFIRHDNLKEVLGDTQPQYDFIPNSTLNEYKNSQKSLNKSNLRSFILVSLLFPLIGGICGALGVYKIRNWFILIKAHLKLWSTRIIVANRETKVSIAKQQLDNYESYVKWCSLNGDSSFIDDTTAFYNGCYSHGYEYGFQKRNIDLDLFDRALEMRKQYAANNRHSNS